MEVSEIILSSIVVPFVVGVGLVWFDRELVGKVWRALGYLGFLVPMGVGVYAMGMWSDMGHVGGGYWGMGSWDLGLKGLGIGLKLGLNGISLPMFFLAGVVGGIAGIYGLIMERVEQRGLYVGLLLMVLSGLMGTFASVDIFFFYFFHEVALIPTFVIMGIMGGRGRRKVGIEMVVYLTVGAMLVLAGLIAIYVKSGIDTFDFVALRGYLAQNPLDRVLQESIFGILMVGFGVLVSLFPFHTWAPGTYTVAPTSLAVMHAGVLKKFGLYGLIQIGLPLLGHGGWYWGDVLAYLALGNVIIIGLIAMVQTDIKRLISYSSVMHVGYAFLGIASMTVEGVGGAVLMMVAHGFSVGLLFILVNGLQRRVQTLEMDQMGGLYRRYPVMAGFFLAGVMANVGLPGFGNFWGEVMIFVSLWGMERWVCFAAVLGIVVSAIYGLRAFAKVFLGKVSKGLEIRGGGVGEDLGWGERVVCMVLLVVLLGMGFYPRVVVDKVGKELGGRGEIRTILTSKR